MSVPRLFRTATSTPSFDNAWANRAISAAGVGVKLPPPPG